MKKITLVAFAFAACGALSSAQAQSNIAPSTQQAEQVQTQTTGKEKIKEEELPEGVKQALKSDVLKEWQVSEVYKLAPEAAAETEATPVYEVYFTNAAQQKTVAQFDEAGQAIAQTEK
ncbi:hypothetical protein [Pontibacter rugosus]|uniref:PepSY domain-containing protein n=1 Tax=Pontibacter rugosus TaxID=1745966 RepID=A0ABW3SR67_9BACT